MPKKIDITEEVIKGSNLSYLLLKSMPEDFLRSGEFDKKDENGHVVWSVELKINGIEADVEEFAESLVSQLDRLAAIKAKDYVKGKLGNIECHLEEIVRAVNKSLKNDFGFDVDDY